MPLLGGVPVAGERASLDEEFLRRLSARAGAAPTARALKAGWLLWSTPQEGRLYELLRRAEIKSGGRKVYVRLTADALAVYEDIPGTGKCTQPIEVMFLASVSAVLGRDKDSDALRVVHTKGVTWVLRRGGDDGAEAEGEDGSLQEWGKCIQSRLSHFRQAKRQSQRITVSTIAKLKESSHMARKLRRKARHFLHRWAPCCEGLCNPSWSGTQFALTRRFGALKEPTPYRGEVEFHSDLVDEAKLKEVSDPELQEAQGAHWSELSVRYLRVCYMVPEELIQDFTLTLRMGAPDGLKRLVWPLAAGEAVEPPRLAGTSSSSTAMATSTPWRDPEETYKSATGRAFGGVDPKSIQLRDPVPTFCQGIAGMEEAPPLRSVVRHLELLNQEGQRALRRLLWSIQLTCHQIEFCPFLPNLMCTLLAFFTEAETMSIVQCIVNKAGSGEDGLRIVCTSKQLNKQAKVFVREGLNKPLTSQALRHLEKLGFELHALAAELLGDGLAKRLPFRAFCRLVGSFLREGSEVITRYGLALVKLRSAELQACATKEDARKLLDNLGAGLTTFAAIESLTKAAFSRLLEDASVHRENSQWGSDYVAPKNGDYRRHLFCRPRLFPPRGLCPDEAWETLWSWVPTGCRIFDPHLVYTPSRDGTSLRSLLQLCKKYAESPMIFFCYTKEGDVIGGYAPAIWVRTNGYIKTNSLRRPVEDSFVFRKMHKQDVEVFTWTGKNDMLFDASEVHGLLFGGQQSAISISKDLTRCTTSTSVSFGSPMLVVPPGSPEADGEPALPERSPSSVQLCGKESADFEMLAFEVFALL